MGNHALAKFDAFIGRKGEIYRVDPLKLVLRPERNIRLTYGLDEADRSLKRFIQVHGADKLPPLEAEKLNDFTLLVDDGYRRMHFILELISEGYPIREVRVILVDPMDDQEAVYHSLARGQGKNPYPLEEAKAFQRLVEAGQKVKQIADRIQMSENFVYTRLRLLEASPETQEALKKGEVGTTVASKVVSSAGRDAVKQARGIRRASAPRIRVVFDKRKLVYKVKGDPKEPQKEMINSIFNDDLWTKLDEMGLDPQSVVFTVNEKVEE